MVIDKKNDGCIVTRFALVGALEDARAFAVIKDGRGARLPRFLGWLIEDRC